MGDKEVCMSLCDSTALLWRVEDLRAVRSQGLVGVLVGSLPRTPRQNGRLGRPLLLLPEEEKLLTEHGPVCSSSSSSSCSQPAVGGDAELRQRVVLYEEDQQRSYQEQRVLALEDRKSALLRAMSSSHTDETVDEGIRARLEALDQSFFFPPSALAVQLSTARVGLAHCPEERALLQAAGQGRADSCCRTRYQVFKNLRGRGFYLTSAGKFGGDFLIYPGDPLRFHAHYIAVCLSLDENVSLLDVLAVARLGSNVKKTVLLCSPDAGGGVTYTSVQWSGMV